MENIDQAHWKPIAVYGRVSTSAQEEQETIEAQLLEVHKFAEKNELRIVNKYLDNGWSGDILARPALDELRLDARKHMWEAVLIYDPDRLGRQLFYQQIVIEELKERGIEILFVTMPPVKNASDELMFGVRGLFAAYEKAKIAERFRIGKVNRVTNNQILLSEAPYGYTYIPNVGKRSAPGYVSGHLVINEKEKKNVLMIFKWVADDGYTLRTIVRKLQEQGIPPRKSKRGVWNTSTLGTLLRNKVYIGKAHWGASVAVVPENPFKDQKYRKIKKTSRRITPEGQWVEITVPRIIEDDNLFIRADARLRENYVLMGRKKVNDYLLGGKIWCTCGKRRTGEGPQHGKHLYYRCDDRTSKFPFTRSCFAKGINARIADSALWSRLNKIMTTPDLMKAELEKWIYASRNQKASKTQVDIEGTKQEIVRLKSREEKFTNAYTEDVISLEKLREYLMPLKEKRSVLENKLAQAYVEQSTQIAISTPSEEEIERFAVVAQDGLKSLSFGQKKGIIRKVITKISSSERELQVYGQLNYNELHVVLQTNHRHRRPTKRRQINTLQRSYKKECTCCELSLCYH